MHLADGFLSFPVAAGGYLIAGGACAVALQRARHDLGERQAPLLGMTGAFVFAAQMLNFPVAPGVSGHFLGAAFGALVLGPLNAVLIMALVLTVQCFVFADGGLSALGANVTNMGPVGCLAAYAAFCLLRAVFPAGRTGFLGGAALAAWLSVVAASCACGLELWYSGTLPLGGVALLVGVHGLIGLGEALITVAALSVILQARPDLVHAWDGAPAPGGTVEAVQ